jgi:hypothetical protein
VKPNEFKAVRERIQLGEFRVNSLETLTGFANKHLTFIAFKQTLLRNMFKEEGKSCVTRNSIIFTLKQILL